MERREGGVFMTHIGSQTQQSIFRHYMSVLLKVSECGRVYGSAYTLAVYQRVHREIEDETGRKVNNKLYFMF